MPGAENCLLDSEELRTGQYAPAVFERMLGGKHMTVRNEYPRPQFVRNEWNNLNGEWDFAFDDKDCGITEKWYEAGVEFDRKITVPFVYQCSLSGVGQKKSHCIVWYKKQFQQPTVGREERLVLHFGAVDYFASVYLNGQLVAEHAGGHTPFSVDITPYLAEGTQNLAVRVYDPYDEEIPRGKQFWKSTPKGIWYTNSTGIWQTVWMEKISSKHIHDVKFTPIFDEGKVAVVCEGHCVTPGDLLCFEITYQNERVVSGSLNWDTDILEWDVDVVQRKIFHTNFHDAGRAWSPEHPNLFDVCLQLKNASGEITDEVRTYFGFRKIHTENGIVYLNNKPFYQRLVLDQGYWKNGLLTAPTDEAFQQDILAAKEMGFQGCRKHQKMEDPRFLYWADKLGYIVWGECASAPVFSQKSVNRLMQEWEEIVQRDYNHPCILVWVPLNESWGIPYIHSNRMQQHFSQMMYHYLHAVDQTRLVISNDGWEATETDICAIHNYMHGEADEKEKYQIFKETLSTRENLLSMPPAHWDIYAKGFANQGEPVMLTEFGGIGYEASDEKGWGYTSVKNEEEFILEYRRVLDAVFASKGLWGFCYTQLYDVEQEINGLLTYDRKPKCDLEQICEINRQYHSCKNRVEKEEEENRIEEL